MQIPRNICFYTDLRARAAGANLPCPRLSLPRRPPASWQRRPGKLALQRDQKDLRKVWNLLSVFKCVTVICFPFFSSYFIFLLGSKQISCFIKIRLKKRGFAVETFLNGFGRFNVQSRSHGHACAQNYKMNMRFKIHTCFWNSVKKFGPRQDNKWLIRWIANQSNKWMANVADDKNCKELVVFGDCSPLLPTLNLCTPISGPNHLCAAHRVEGSIPHWVSSPSHPA